MGCVLEYKPVFQKEKHTLYDENLGLGNNKPCVHDFCLLANPECAFVGENNGIQWLCGLKIAKPRVGG
jgi:hypothetical protein